MKQKNHIEIYKIFYYISFDYSSLYTKKLLYIHKLKKNRRHNGQKKKDKKTNNNLQNIHIKLKIK